MRRAKSHRRFALAGAVAALTVVSTGASSRGCACCDVVAIGIHRGAVDWSSRRDGDGRAYAALDTHSTGVADLDHPLQHARSYFPTSAGEVDLGRSDLVYLDLAALRVYRGCALEKTELEVATLRLYVHVVPERNTSSSCENLSRTLIL